MKKLIATPALALAAGIGLAACSSQAAHNSVPVATHSAPAKPVATHSAKPAAPGIGQSVKAGAFTFTVTKFKCGLNILGVPGEAAATGNGPGGLSVPLHGQFCIAVVSEQNASSQPHGRPFDVKLLGTNGSTYKNDDTFEVTWSATNEYLSATLAHPQSEINPGTTYQEVFVWDVPAGVQASSVTVNTGFSGDGSATVNVH